MQDLQSKDTKTCIIHKVKTTDKNLINILLTPFQGLTI